MSKEGQAGAGACKTRAQLEAALPDDAGGPRRLAAEPMAEEAVPGREPGLARKSPGGIPGKLPNRARARMAGELKGRLPPALLPGALALPAGSRYYAAAAARRPDPHPGIRPLIHETAAGSGSTCGSPRVWPALRRRGVTTSEKAVRRPMREERVEARRARRERKRPGCIGEAAPAAGNLAKGGFHAGAPDEPRPADVSGFAASDGKARPSPVIDCYDGVVVPWPASRRPDGELVGDVPGRAVGALGAGKRAALEGRGSPDGLAVHAGRGGHHGGGARTGRAEGVGITRPMPRKGDGGGGAAREGFSGRMKAEMCYGIKWRRASDLEAAIDGYIDFHDNRRITAKFDGMTIAEHRDMLAKVSKKAS